MSKSDLILSLMEKKGMTLAEAKEFAEEFYEEHPEPVGPLPGVAAAGVGIAGAIPMVQGVRRASGLPVPAINQSTLKAMQVAELVASGATLCPNCQQDVRRHLPGCSRGPLGTDMKATTKNPLPPVSG